MEEDKIECTGKVVKAYGFEEASWTTNTLDNSVEKKICLAAEQ